MRGAYVYLLLSPSLLSRPLHTGIEDDFKNLEQFMAKRGTPVTRIADGDVAATAAVAAAGEMPAEEEAPAPAPPKPIDGVTDEQAARIREAVRANKQRRRQQGADGS